MPRTLKLLLVEDSDEHTRAVVNALEDAGFAVAWQQVRTEQELSAAFQDRWDLVISNDRLTRLIGKQALALCQQHDSAVPFLFLCADPGWEWAVEVMRAGARSCLPKSDLSRLPPVVAGELDAALRERKRRAASDAVGFEYRRFQNVFHAAPVALLELDLSGMQRFLDDLREPAAMQALLADDELLRTAVRRIRVLGANRAALQLLHAAAAENIDGGRLVAVERASAWCNLLRAFRNAGALVQQEISVGTMDGGSVETLIAFQVPRAPTGYASLVVGIVDIGAQKRAERRALTGECVHAAGRLAGVVAHDFNNMLTIIKGYTGLVLDSVADGEPMRKDLLAIDAAAGTAEVLTRRLLTFGRSRRADPLVLRIDESLPGIRKPLERALGDGIELSIVLADDVWPVEMDPSHFEQVLTNLAVNAREAMPVGGTLVIEARNTRDGGASAGLARDVAGDFVALSVRDTGYGMNEEVRRQVFEPCFTTRDAARGAGLGLSIVYAMVRQAGGFIDVTSEPGQGAVFEILLPRHG